MHDYIPLRFGAHEIDPRPMLDIDVDLFTFLEGATGQSVASVVTDLEAVLASDDSAEALKVAVGHPVARALQAVLGPGNVPLAYEVTTHRTDVIRIRITR